MSEPYKVKGGKYSVYETVDYETALAWFKYYEHKFGYAEMWHKGLCYRYTLL